MPTSMSTGIARRYALAAFSLIAEQHAYQQLESDITTLQTALDESADMRAFISDPSYGRTDQVAAIQAIAKKAGIGEAISNTLALMAQNRRLSHMHGLLEVLGEMLREHKGIVPVEVTSAKALTKKQSDELAATIKESLGKEIEIRAAVDEKIIGGLIVKVGSQMVDTSIRSKLNSLQNIMKEVG